VCVLLLYLCLLHFSARPYAGQAFTQSLHKVCHMPEAVEELWQLVCRNKKEKAVCYRGHPRPNKKALLEIAAFYNKTYKYFTWTVEPAEVPKDAKTTKPTPKGETPKSV
jgi:hypothetical protein